MGKIFALILGMLLLPTCALASEDPFFNPQAQTMDAGNIFKTYEQNKFAFKKNFTDKRMLVAGYIEKVGEGQFDEAGGKGPKMPYVLLKGLFRAYIDDPSGAFDLANITPGDALIVDCSQVSEGTMGFFVRGMCHPVMQTRKANNETRLVWITQDKSVMEYAFTPTTIQKLTSGKK